MSQKNKNTNPDQFEAVENALSKTEQYIEENQKSLTIIMVAIAVIVGAYFGYKRLYLAPIEREAQEQMYAAEQYFERDSFNIALNGDGNNFGFLDIIEDYGVSKSANLAHYYSGICYLRLGDFESAIDYLKSFDADDKMIAPIAMGAIGDAYMELGEESNALDFYKKAAYDYNNDFTSPIYLMKVALVYERESKFDKALEVYEKIQKDYPNTTEGRQIEKYIAKVKLNLSR